jgi:hypothetical protein
MTQQTQLLLWSAHPLLQLSVGAVIFWRKLQRKFPVFLAYILSQVVVFAVLFPVYIKGAYKPFFYGYWISEGISLVIGFMVIQEVFLDVFQPYHALKDLGLILFKWAGLVMLLVAGVVAATSPATSQGPLVEAVVTLQRCVRVIQCGLVLFLLVFSTYLGVSWRQRSFGIALGFGGFASVELFAVALNTSGYIGSTSVNIANMCAYNLAIMTWAFYMWAEESAREAPAGLVKSQRWDQSLGDLQNPVAGDSLIPMFEGMVERAFSRAGADSDSETMALTTAKMAPSPLSKKMNA